VDYLTRVEYSRSPWWDESAGVPYLRPDIRKPTSVTSYPLARRHASANLPVVPPLARAAAVCFVRPYLKALSSDSPEGG